MRARCPSHTFVGTGVLAGHRWIISTRGYANVVASAAASDVVWGVVYTLAGTDEARLDQAEGVSAGCYAKQLLSVAITTGELTGRELTALVYVDPRVESGKPHDEYIVRINRGLADCAGIPVDWVDAVIRPFIPAAPAAVAAGKTAAVVAEKTAGGGGGWMGMASRVARHEGSGA